MIFISFISGLIIGIELRKPILTLCMKKIYKWINIVHNYAIKNKELRDTINKLK